jgi:hypothetical protein
MPASLFTPNDSKYVIVDTGASTCATSEKSDFVTGTLQELSQPFALDGIAGSIKGTHLGKCRYEVLSDDGSIAVLETHAYYAPGMNATLFSPQHYFLQQHTNGYKNYKMTVDHNKSIFHLGSKTVTIQHDPTFRLPIMRCYKDVMTTAETLDMTCVTDEFNQNLTTLQKILLQWHWRLGHVGFQKLQWIGRQGWLGKIGEKFGQSSVHAPKCASCQFGKQERNPKAGSKIKVDTDREGILKADKLNPGDLIFSDQYVSSVPGRVFGRRGASIASQKY